MSPPEKEDNTKKPGVPSEPLCLFCFPEDTSFVGGKTYVNPLRREPDPRRPTEKVETARQKTQRREKEELWLRKRTEARIRRRRTKEPIRNLTSYLLASVKNEKGPPQAGLPSLFEVLETVKDAWPSPSSRNVTFHGHENQTKQTSSSEDKMKDEKIKFTSQLLNRRLSMPEELMRKYSVKEKTSEESETNKTALEVSPSSSSTLETARRKDAVERPNPNPVVQPTKTDACQQTSDSDDGKTKKTDRPKRAMQSDYYKQGQRVIKVKAADKGACTCHQTSTSASAKEDTDDSGTTESIPSSSPTRIPKRESSSGNLSSESDNLRCTCAELSSKETSTDLYFSGKSTLSQTISDKSMSTQDSTVSINSVSTRGSTVSDNSNSTTPEIERTSAKETTTSPDYSPRTPRNRKNRRRDKKLGFYHDSGKTCPKHSRSYLSLGYGGQCPVHSEHSPEKQTKATNTEDVTTQTVERSQSNEETGKNQEKEEKPELQAEDRYKWAKLSQEELYMMQQLRHRKFVENQRKLSNPLPPTPDADTVTVCGTASSYAETERLEQSIMIPRYSALPRTLSMLVNTSSADTSHNSDSDSLADSLEEQPITHVHKLYFDTKKESKPVRGDASVVPDNKQRQREPRGRAFFVSIKEPFGEDEMLENIEKIPQPPEKIKNQIFERHLNLCTKHKLQHKTEERKEKTETGLKKRKPTSKTEEKTPKTKKNPPTEEGKKHDRKNLSEKTKRSEQQKPKTESRRQKDAGKDAKGRLGSKIPVLTSSRSGSSSPERDAEPKEKSARPKTRVKRQKEESAEKPPKQTEVETTQILEITQSGTELSLQKPQAIIHPSVETKPEPQLTIPPLVSTLRPAPPRQNWNKQILFAQARRSPIAKFRQRFEVIPEEKSSSLSSAEETHPKFADASTSPLPSDSIQFHSYNVNDVSNLLVAKITNKQLETLPYVKGNDSQKIILFSSKPQNSSKGRDALIAMNREDFNRLAKGWMNFYKLNENMGNSENEEKHAKTEENEPQNNKKPPKETAQQQKQNTEEPELGDSVRLDCSNTILRKTERNSLPELKPPGQRGCEMHRSATVGSLPRVAKHLEDDDDTDSDSTDYMEPPSPRVPPLPIDDIPSDATLSSTDDELKPQPKTLKYLQVKKRTAVNKPGLRKGNSFDTSRLGKKKNSGWSVTVAGTVELSRSAPDLEMRLSFPANGGPPVVSQSDSGFAEDSNYSKLSESLQDLDSYMSRQELPLGSGNLKQKWMVTVKNSKGDNKDGLAKETPHLKPLLPNLEPAQGRNPKKVLKDVQLDEKVKRVVERKMRAIWPKVQKVIKKEFLTESGRLVTEIDEFDGGSCLSVRGNAVLMEKKQKPPTMTERDITRRYTSRTND